MSTTALFDPSRSDISADLHDRAWMRLPFDANMASRFRSGSHELLSQRPGSRTHLEEKFVTQCLGPMSAELVRPMPKDAPVRYPLDFRPSTRTLIRILALLAVDTWKREDDSAHALSSRLIEALARLPAGAGNTQDDAAQAERNWLRDYAKVFLPLLEMGAKATFVQIDGGVELEGGGDALPALYAAALKGLKAWQNDANEELIRSWGLPVTAFFEPTLPQAMVLSGQDFTLETGGPTYVVAGVEDGRRQVFMRFPPTLADDLDVPRHALLGTIDRRGFVPEPKNAAITRTPRVASNLADLAGAINEVPVKSLDIPGDAEARATSARGLDLFDVATWSDRASLTPKEQDAAVSKLAEQMLGLQEVGVSTRTERPSPLPLPPPVPAEGVPTVVLPPMEKKHRAQIREIRLALTMSPKEFLEAVLVTKPVFPNPLEYATIVMEWESLPGELNSLELLTLASGLGLPMEFLVSYLDGELILSGLLKRRQPPKRYTPPTTPRGVGDW